MVPFWSASLKILCINVEIFKLRDGHTVIKARSQSTPPHSQLTLFFFLFANKKINFFWCFANSHNSDLKINNLFLLIVTVNSKKKMFAIVSNTHTHTHLAFNRSEIYRRRRGEEASVQTRCRHYYYYYHHHERFWNQSSNLRQKKRALSAGDKLGLLNVSAFRACVYVF